MGEGRQESKGKSSISNGGEPALPVGFGAPTASLGSQVCHVSFSKPPQSGRAEQSPESVKNDRKRYVARIRCALISIFHEALKSISIRKQIELCSVLCLGPEGRQPRDEILDNKPLIKEAASEVHCWSSLVHCRCPINGTEMHNAPRTQTFDNFSILASS